MRDQLCTCAWHALKILKLIGRVIGWLAGQPDKKKPLQRRFVIAVNRIIRTRCRIIETGGIP